MAFDFPTSPTEGQIFTPAGGPAYQYRAPAWTISLPTSNVEARRNRIVNGAMQISQEWGNTGAGPGSAITHFAADQWATASNTGTGTSSAARVQSVTPNGSKDRIRFAVVTAKASLAVGEYAQFRSWIEGGRVADFRYGTAFAKQSILRFGWKSPAGTYSIGFHNSAFNRSYVAQFTISAGQANTDTEQTVIVPGDVTGTWLTDTGTGVFLTFTIAAASDVHGTTGWQAGYKTATASNANGMATNGNIFELFDVGLYLDAQNTGLAPRWEIPDEAQELVACRRYWQTVYAFSGGYTGPGAGQVSPLTLPVQMRVTPAAATTGTPTNTNVTGTAWASEGVSNARMSAVGAALGGFVSAAFGTMNARM